MSQPKKHGLGNASEETIQRVTSMGGSAKHETRGLQSASKEDRSRVARLGGLSRAKKYKDWLDRKTEERRTREQKQKQFDKDWLDNGET